MTLQAYRGQLLHFIDDPRVCGEAAWCHFADGLLLVEKGCIRQAGDAATLLAQLPAELPVEHFPQHLIVPGFVDTHIHYPQSEMIGAYGEQLLTWLSTYTFPTELKFNDPNYAKTIADFFIAELLRNGTTTALVFGTVHSTSIDAFFRACQTHNLRMIAGKVLMDRHAPQDLCDSAESGYQQSQQLIHRWHGQGRLQYAITPRFAPTSSAEQLRRAGQLLAECPDVYLHTHLAESQQEVQWVGDLFPERKHYLDVYDHAGLLGRRSVFAHGIHLQDDECRRLAHTGSAIAHCPSSNLFLGSGLLDLPRLQGFGINLGLGTDVGAGSSFSMFRTMDEAYKIQQLRGACLDPFQAFYLATLGGAKALDLQEKIGNFAPGKEADFLILDLHATELLKFRMPYCQTLQDILFVLNTLADDRVVERTYALGVCVHRR